MKYRMAVALLALVGLFVSSYLYLYKVGLIGTMVCGTGGCETVQLSAQSRFLGIEVAAIGMAGYAVILGVALVALSPRFSGDAWPVLALVGLSGGAVAFTIYLKYLEFFVIKAICQWCVVSAVIIAILFILTIIELKRTRTAPSG